MEETVKPSPEKSKRSSTKNVEKYLIKDPVKLAAANAILRNSAARREAEEKGIPFKLSKKRSR